MPLPKLETLVKVAEEASNAFKDVAARLKADAGKRARAELRALAADARDEITGKLLELASRINR